METKTPALNKHEGRISGNALILDVSPTKGQGIALGPLVIMHWDE